MADSSHLPAVCEPWFLAFHARVTVRPAMSLHDLADALLTSNMRSPTMAMR